MDSESKVALVSLMKWLGSEVNNGNDGRSQNAQQRTKQERVYVLETWTNDEYEINVKFVPETICSNDMLTR